MTNKTELLPCPCCGGQAKEMYTYLTSVEWVACLKCGLETKGFGNAEAAAKAWNTRAAPAEDVRAVVEEPAAYADPKSFKNFNNLAHLGGLYTHEWMWARPAAGLVPLYRHPQRPVVLPERRNVDPNTAETILQWHKDCEWNACVDAVERLNK